jgi:hypothetical protein
MAKDSKPIKRSKQRGEEDSLSRESPFVGPAKNPFVWRAKRHRHKQGGAPLIRWPWKF